MQLFVYYHYFFYILLFIMKVSSRSIMEVPLHIRYERYLDENRNRSGKMRLIRGYFIFGICGMKLKEEKKERPSWTLER